MSFLSILESCPLQTTRSGPKVEGSLSICEKVINTYNSLLEQKKSLDWTKVCSICHSAQGCFDYTGDCMG